MTVHAHDFDADTALVSRGKPSVGRRLPGGGTSRRSSAGRQLARLRAWAPEHWFVARGPNGGFLAAVAARAAEQAAGRPLRSLDPALRRAARGRPARRHHRGGARRPLLQRGRDPHRAGGPADDARARHARRAARRRRGLGARHDARGHAARGGRAARAGDHRRARLHAQLRHAPRAARGRRPRLRRLAAGARAARARRAARRGDDRRVGARRLHRPAARRDRADARPHDPLPPPAPARRPRARRTSCSAASPAASRSAASGRRTASCGARTASCSCSRASSRSSGSRAA